MNALDEILVATDLSASAGATYRWAAGFALGYGARVTLLHVRELPDAYRTSSEVAAYIDRVASYHDGELEAVRDWFAEWGIAVRIETASGRASQRIIEVARRQDAGLVVIGKSGQRGLERLLFGTTTKRVLRKVKRPLLVVPPQAGPLAASSGADLGHPAVFNRLMTTTDFGADSKRGLVQALQLARALEVSELLLTHVLRPPTGPNISEIEAFPDCVLDAATKEAQDRLAALVARLDSRRLVPRLLVHDGVASAIAAAAEEEQVDLIIVPSHGKGAFGAVFLGSVSEGVLRRAHQPVLVLPRPYLERIFGLSG